MITATVAHPFLAALLLMPARPTKPRAHVVFVVVAPVSPSFDIHVHSTRSDIDSLGELDRMLLRGSRSDRECAAGNDRDTQENSLHGQPFPKAESTLTAP
jgi:hypothetical protein